MNSLTSDYEKPYCTIGSSDTRYIEGKRCESVCLCELVCVCVSMMGLQFDVPGTCYRVDLCVMCV
jgi:hypothetical protein